MINLKKIFMPVMVVFIFVSCNKDNYAEPTGTISGAIIDAETSDSIQTEVPNGARIQLFEQGRTAVAPINFWTRTDGSFENTRVFDATYKIVATGPFFTPDTISATVPSSAPLIFKVIPYLRVSQSVIGTTANSITVKYKITRSKVGDKIARRACIIGTNKYLNINVFKERKLINTEGSDDQDILSGEYTETFTGLEPNTTYYIRSGSRTINNGSLYNYTQPLAVTTTAQ